jgi:hypothetical protein
LLDYHASAKVRGVKARSAEVERVREGANVEVWHRRSWLVLSTKDIFFWKKGVRIRRLIS